jgi:hypothetical protein
MKISAYKLKSTTSLTAEFFIGNILEINISFCKISGLLIALLGGNQWD